MPLQSANTWLFMIFADGNFILLKDLQQQNTPSPIFQVCRIQYAQQRYHETPSLRYVQHQELLLASNEGSH